jgi:hypothetical protein
MKGDVVVYRLDEVGLIKRDKTDCLVGRLSGEGGEEYASH